VRAFLALSFLLVALSGCVELAGPPPVREELHSVLCHADGEAHLAWLHPSDGYSHARAAARLAGETAALLTAHPPLRPAGTALDRAAAALGDAAQRQNPVDVRARAADLEDVLYQVDAALPEVGSR
jgi:hypothetical protein